MLSGFLFACCVVYMFRISFVVLKRYSKWLEYWNDGVCVCVAHPFTSLFVLFVYINEVFCYRFVFILATCLFPPYGYRSLRISLWLRGSQLCVKCNRKRNVSSSCCKILVALHVVLVSLGFLLLSLIFSGARFTRRPVTNRWNISQQTHRWPRAEDQRTARGVN